MTRHLDYDEPILGYHEVVAELAASLLPTPDRRPAAYGPVLPEALGGPPASGSRPRVVDLGCGPGQILGELADRRPDATLVGVDGDPECLRRAAARCPDAALVEADISDPGPALVGRHGPFDLVLSSHSLEHLPDPVAALGAWRGLLRPGGRLVVAVPNVLQPLMMARALVRRPKANDGHYYVWDRAHFENFCRLAGFGITERALDYVPLVPVRTRRRFPAIAGIERALLGPLPHFSNSHIVVLEPGEPRRLDRPDRSDRLQVELEGGRGDHHPCDL